MKTAKSFIIHILTRDSFDSIIVYHLFIELQWNCLISSKTAKRHTVCNIAASGNLKILYRALFSHHHCELKKNLEVAWNIASTFGL